MINALIQFILTPVVNYIIMWVLLKHLFVMEILSLTLHYTVPTFNEPRERGLFKTIWEKEKMLVTSIFSFSQNVSYPS